MGVAYRRGDGLVVVEGPLVGCERMLGRVDRPNSMAHLGLHAGRTTTGTTVGQAAGPTEERRACRWHKDGSRNAGKRSKRRCPGAA